MDRKELEDKMAAGLRGHPWSCEAKASHVDLGGGKICPKCQAQIPNQFGPLEYQNFFGPRTSEEVPDPEQDLKSETEGLRLTYEKKMTELQVVLGEVEDARSVGNTRARQAAFDRAESLRTDGRKLLLTMNHVGAKIRARRMGHPEPPLPGFIARLSAPYD